MESRRYPRRIRWCFVVISLVAHKPTFVIISLPNRSLARKGVSERNSYVFGQVEEVDRPATAGRVTDRPSRQYRTVCRLMRHKQIQVTMRYAHLADKHLANAVARLAGGVSASDTLSDTLTQASAGKQEYLQ